MSSILRALKKLENEPRHLEETSPLDSKFVPLADTSVRKTSMAVLMMIIGGGIACGLVILAGWWLYSEKTRLPAVVPQKISRQGLQQTEMAPATPQEIEPSAPAAVSVAPALPAADIAVSPKTADPLSASIPGQIPEPSIPPIGQKTVMPAAEQAAGSAIQMPPAPSQESIEQGPAQGVAVAITRPPDISGKVKDIEIPVLNDPEMKLQAITWSKDPQKRIAVINNRILRQGDVVSGYRIDTINQDDVVLNDAGEKWKILFRIK